MPNALTDSSDVQPRFRKGVVLEGPAFLEAGIARHEFSEFFDDLIGDAGQSLPPGLVGAKTGASGNNTIDYDSAACGTYSLTHSADSEAQTMRLDSGDNLWINLSKKPKVTIRAKINLAGATFSADQRAVIGVASAYNATLDDVATNAWFRVEGASNNILVEGDDGTTDTDDQDSGVDLTDDTFHVFEIDFTDLSAVKFTVDGTPSSVEVDISDVSANTLVQPLIAIQRDAGTEAEVLTVDFVHVIQERT